VRSVAYANMLFFHRHLSSLPNIFFCAIFSLPHFVGGRNLSLQLINRIKASGRHHSFLPTWATEPGSRGSYAQTWMAREIKKKAHCAIDKESYLACRANDDIERKTGLRRMFTLPWSDGICMRSFFLSLVLLLSLCMFCCVCFVVYVSLCMFRCELLLPQRSTYGWTSSCWTWASCPSNPRACCTTTLTRFALWWR